MLRISYAAILVVAILSAIVPAAHPFLASRTTKASPLLLAKGFGTGKPQPQPQPSPRKPKPSAPRPAPSGGGELNLDRLGGAAASTGSAPSSPEERDEDAIFRQFGVDTPDDKRKAKRKATQEDFEDRARLLGEPQGNLVTSLPPEVQETVENVLKVGLTIFGTAFLLDGFLITYDAFMISSKKEIPPALIGTISKFEPLFTPILLALFGCSILLGIFKLQQFDAPAATYSEDNFRE